MLQPPQERSHSKGLLGKGRWQRRLKPTNKRPRKGQYSPSREYYRCYIVCSKLQNGTGRINQPPTENKDNNDIPALEDTSRDNSEAEEPEGTHKTTEKTLLTSVNLAATVTTTEPEHKLEIYNSGATQHMIPSHHRLINFQPIQPQGILAADCHDLAKQLSYYISFPFLFFYLELTIQKEVWKSVMSQVSHSHSHMTGSHSVISHDVT